jgi:dTDP-4-amino-4,6-dideoxygalactose transaminase
MRALHAGGVVHYEGDTPPVPLAQPPRGVGPHQVTRDFEAALCRYTGAPYAVAVNSCTAALLLACAWHFRNAPPDAEPHRDGTVYGRWPVEIPRRTYVSVPQSIIHAGGRVTFRDEEWHGYYRLRPYPIFDCARWFTSDMFMKGAWFAQGCERLFLCTSFHWSKTLGIQQGGAILHDDPAADAWFRRARFDGRREGVAPKDDDFDMIGWHCYMSPEVAAEGLVRLSFLPRDNAPLPNDDYPDLSKIEVFR